MKEDLLHFIWKYKKLGIKALRTTNGALVEILDVGLHNHLSGPDFFNSKIRIDGQLWAGTVEIHLKSTDWYAHHHETDISYNTVVLHVVWEDDGKVFRSDNSPIPTLELKDYISPYLLKSYSELMDKENIGFINCERHIAEVDSFIFQNWLERLYFERLEKKSELISKLLKTYANDWEHVLFVLLLKNFGSKINGDSFLSIAKALDFKIVRKIQHNLPQLESMFLGTAGLLDNTTIVDAYYLELQKEYVFLDAKFSIGCLEVRKPDFFKLRPPNFPTIRLSQIANLYKKHQGLFDRVMNASSLGALYDIFTVSASGYWDNHFTFGKETNKKNVKKLTKPFIDLLIINTILPLRFSYAKHTGRDANETIIAIITELANEQNVVVENFLKLQIGLENAMESQAILQLYTHYCTLNKCLQCAVGTSLLKGNN